MYSNAKNNIITVYNPLMQDPDARLTGRVNQPTLSRTMRCDAKARPR